MQTYTPKETQIAEKQLRAAFLAQTKGQLPSKFERVALTCEFYMPFPSSISKKRQEEWHEKQHHLKRPDLDNLVKLVCDALNGAAFEDDNVVSEIHAKKLYSKRPRTEIYLTYF